MLLINQHWVFHLKYFESLEQCAGLRCREIVTGKPSPLLSSFKLSYYTLLNLMRRMENSGQNMEYVIQHSFQQYQFERTLPDKQVLIALPV